MSNPGSCPPHRYVEVSRTPQPDIVKYDKNGKEISRTKQPDIVVKQCFCGATI